MAISDGSQRDPRPSPRSPHKRPAPTPPPPKPSHLQVSSPVTSSSQPLPTVAITAPSRKGTAEAPPRPPPLRNGSSRTGSVKSEEASNDAESSSSSRSRTSVSAANNVNRLTRVFEQQSPSETSKSNFLSTPVNTRLRSTSSPSPPAITVENPLNNQEAIEKRSSIHRRASDASPARSSIHMDDDELEPVPDFKNIRAMFQGTRDAVLPTPSTKPSALSSRQSSYGSISRGRPPQPVPIKPAALRYSIVSTQDSTSSEDDSDEYEEKRSRATSTSPTTVTSEGHSFEEMLNQSSKIPPKPPAPRSAKSISRQTTGDVSVKSISRQITGDSGIISTSDFSLRKASIATALGATPTPPPLSPSSTGSSIRTASSTNVPPHRPAPVPPPPAKPLPTSPLKQASTDVPRSPSRPRPALPPIRPVRPPALRRSSAESFNQTPSSPASSASTLTVARPRLSRAFSVGSLDQGTLTASPASSSNTVGGQELTPKDIALKRITKRRNILKELYTTEISYAKDMSLLERVYLQGAKERDIMRKEDLRMIFGNLEQIKGFAEDMSTYLREAIGNLLDSEDITDLAELETLDEKTSVGQCFNAHMEDLQATYAEYCKRHETAVLRLQELEQNDPTFAAFLAECKETVQNQTTAWDLSSLLIKPVQRVLKYPLLLSQIVEQTKADHPDLGELLSASSEIIHVADRINEIKKRKDIVEKIVGSRKKNESDIRHGITKGLTRRSEKLKQTVGLTEGTRDAAYEALVERFRFLESQCHLFLREIANWMRIMREYFDFQNYFADALEEFYTVFPPVEERQGQKMASYRKSVGDFSNTVGAQLERSVRSIIFKEGIGGLLDLMKNPAAVMAKRDKKLLDFDRCRAIRERGDQPDKNLQASADAYTSINAQLLDELPKFFVLVGKYIDAIIEAFATIQAGFYGQMRKRYLEFYTSWTDAVDSVRFKDLDVVKEWEEQFWLVDTQMREFGALQGANARYDMTLPRSISQDDSMLEFLRGDEKPSVVIQRSASSDTKDSYRQDTPSPQRTERIRSLSHEVSSARPKSDPFDDAKMLPPSRRPPPPSTRPKPPPPRARTGSSSLRSGSGSSIATTPTTGTVPTPPLTSEEMFMPLPKIPDDTHAAANDIQTAFMSIEGGTPTGYVSSPGVLSDTADPLEQEPQRKPSRPAPPRPAKKPSIGTKGPVKKPSVEQQYTPYPELENLQDVQDQLCIFQAASIYPSSRNIEETIIPGEAGYKFLAFGAGELLEVYREDKSHGLWFGKHEDGRVGWVDSNFFVKID